MLSVTVTEIFPDGLHRAIIVGFGLELTSMLSAAPMDGRYQCPMLNHLGAGNDAGAGAGVGG